MAVTPTAEQIHCVSDLDRSALDFLRSFYAREEADKEKAGRILVVDDDQRHRESLVNLLTLSGYDCLSAGSGRETLDLLDTRKIDLILLDLLMPEMDGHRVMELVRSKKVDSGIIVVSGESTWNAAAQVLRNGADNFIRKPYASDEVLRAVENYISKRSLQKQNQQIVRQQQVSEQLHRFLVNNSPDLIYILDSRGRFSFINDRVEALLGIRKEDLLHRHFSTILTDSTLASRLILDENAKDGKIVRMESTLKGQRNGDNENNDLTFEIMVMGVRSQETSPEDRQFLGTFGVARDITERKKAEEQVSFQAYHDLLTGLPNRSLFKDRLSLAIRQSQRDEGKVAVLFIDLDRFKLINDTLGHSQGDLLLQAVARRIEDCIRSGDTLSRIGGDEFILLMPQLKLNVDAGAFADNIIDILQKPFTLGPHEVFIRASIGIAIYPDHGNDAETLLKHSDMAMYEVKKRGRNGAGFYSPQLDKQYMHRLSLETELHRALDRNEFVVYYQPQVNIATRSMRGLEALVRWQHPERGFLLPSDFLSVAEDNGLIVPIGTQIIEQIFADIQRWMKRGIEPPLIAINIAALQLEQPNFDLLIIGLLEKYGIPGSCIELELAEKIINRKIKGMSGQLRKLADHGVKLAIDDFGTGYFSLNYLQQFPVNTLKIDQSFVQDIDIAAGENVILSTMVAMARGLGMSLIAEGIESEDQASSLNKLGCEQGQGYLFSNPISGAEADQYLQALHPSA